MRTRGISDAIERPSDERWSAFWRKPRRLKEHGVLMLVPPLSSGVLAMPTAPKSFEEKEDPNSTATGVPSPFSPRA
jgi:hypothetical protein